jgi:UDP-N-acetylglucosamine 2-epimerase
VGRKERRNTALVVTSRNVHRHIVAPVIDGLKQRDWNVRVLRLERIWERVERFLSKTTKRRSLKSFYEKPKPTKPSKRKFSLYDLLARVVFRAAKFLRLERPSIIIVMTDTTPPCRVAVLVGKLAGIPTLLLLHSGMVGRNYDCPHFVVDKIAVTGEFAKNKLMDCGIENERIVITGQPSYDSLIEAQKHFSRNAICRKLGLDPAKKIIVYTTENLPPKENEKMARIICRTVKGLPNVEFVIKVHPSELDLSVYKNVTEELRLNVLITRDAPIYAVLYVSDVVITGFSATALDGMILDKPVITVNLTGFEDPLPFAESGAAIGVYEEKDLVEALEKGLYDEKSRASLKRAREKFVYSHVYKLDGKAASRVVELIWQIVAAY